MGIDITERIPVINLHYLLDSDKDFLCRGGRTRNDSRENLKTIIRRKVTGLKLRFKDSFDSCVIITYPVKHIENKEEIVSYEASFMPLEDYERLRERNYEERIREEIERRRASGRRNLFS